jgi:hypothetical protein
MDQAVKQRIEDDGASMMDAYKELAVPGAPHKMLAGRTGKWRVASKHWMDVDKPPMESEGTCERKMVLGGRYLQEEFSGDMMGSPFTGLGFTAYDNHNRKYVSTWMDSMSTGIYVFEGTASADGKTITMDGHFDDAVKGPVTWTLKTTIKDDKTEEFEMNMTTVGGKKEMCTMAYTRL